MLVDLVTYSRNDMNNLIEWIYTAEDLFNWSAITFTFPLDASQLDRHFEEVTAADNRLMFKVVDAETLEHVGHVEITRLDKEKGTASIAYVLVNPVKRGLGYGSLIMQSILNTCFLILKLTKVSLFVFPFNQAAVHCYQKLGFEIEQTISDLVKRKDEFVPVYLMGLDHAKWLTFKPQVDHQ